MLYQTLLKCLIYLEISRSSLAYYYRQEDNGMDVDSSPNRRDFSLPLYSSWTTWSPCSASCGVGITTRTRTCLRSRLDSRGIQIPLCIGDVVEHKICNLKACPENSPGVREAQCSQHNNRIVAGRFIKEWRPAMGGPNPCELRCEASDERFVYGFGKATDGAPCPRGLCLDGRCMSVGCDERLGSKVERDMCGVCGGQNSGCVHYKDLYHEQPKAASSRTYSEVVVLPASARNIIIRQTAGKNILALQDRNKGIIFNNDPSPKKDVDDYHIAGATIEFNKGNNSTDELIIKEPLRQELYVLVLLRAYNPGIYYEYWLPKHVHINNFAEPIPFPDFPKQTKLYEDHPTQPPNTMSSYKHTKPAFAYPYGEKPQKGQAVPIFRKIQPTVAPTFATTVQTEPSQSLPLEDAGYSSTLPADEASVSDKTKSEYSRRNKHSKSPDPVYGLKYITKAPALDYYQTYRNSSKFQVRMPDISSQTQGDSGYAFRRSPVLDNRILGDRTYQNRGIPIAKRGQNSLENHVPNGRLKYDLDAKTFGNKSLRNHSDPISINVLPDTYSYRKNGARYGDCEPCKKIRNQKKHFCESDFVIRAAVINFEFIEGETRYELKIIQTFRNLLSLLPREYIWSPDICQCPKLKSGREYILMGRQDNGYKRRESRLLVDRDSFVRAFNPKTEKRLQRLRRSQGTKCRRVS